MAYGMLGRRSEGPVRPIEDGVGATRWIPVTNAMGKQAIRIALVLVCGLSAGCPLARESNEEACERAMRHTFSCGMEGAGGPEGLEPDELDALVTLTCSDTPEGSECPWPAFADCITAFSCDELVSLEPEPGNEPCADIMEELEDNACMPTGFCGPVGPTMLVLPIGFVGLRFARRKWMC